MKYLSLIRRRADLDRPAFRRYYEEVHAPLALRFFPPQLYQRNHLDEAAEWDFDCLSEFAYPDDFDPMHVLEGEAGPLLAQDEANFIAREFTRSAWGRTLRSHQPGATGERQRELWLVPHGAGEHNLLACFERLLPALVPGQGACLEMLEPYYCESFPFAALISFEGVFAGALDPELQALGTLRLAVSCCPSPT
ncbi:EthD domain-containing protein [Pseudomonas sp. H9]|uniref:EthD domain-containing protein n=1 Tax=Pseudomonas sp. H9 TaxID=483968 RepID=UPI001058266B|nr:EthD domain-containing protein [Pseudomonas sp. H9]TDF85962.1 hypothetical protein E1573_03280 [Pseudomonas sp. H9]